jgi:hypothetical protein
MLTEIHHLWEDGAENPPMEVTAFVEVLHTLTPDDIRRISTSLASEALTDEVDWWRATIAIDEVLRHSRCTRRAARVAAEAAHAVQSAASRGGLPLPDPEVTRVARAAADVARGLVAGRPARPIVRLLLEHWEPIVAIQV